MQTNTQAHPEGNRSRWLSTTEQADLVAALDDEYMARATYRQVIADFGPVRPFVNIVEAEDRHVQALVRLFHRYAVPVPDDTWPGRAPRYASWREACEAAVDAEIENASLYDRLLAGTEHADVLGVYRNLQAASQQRHLEAFRRCADRDGGDGRAASSIAATGPGRRRRRRGAG